MTVDHQYINSFVASFNPLFIMTYIHSFNCPEQQITIDDLDANFQYKTENDIKKIDEAVQNSNCGDLTIKAHWYWSGAGENRIDDIYYKLGLGWYGNGAACAGTDFSCTESPNGYSPSLEYLIFTNDCNLCAELKANMIYGNGYLEVPQSVINNCSL